MPMLIQRALAFALFALLSGPLFAAGTVQLVLNGRVYADSAQRIEFKVRTSTRSLEVRTSLAQGTSAADALVHLSKRLTAAGIGHYRGADNPSNTPQLLFVENVEFIEARFGGGLELLLQSMDEMPTQVAVRPPLKREVGGRATLESYVTLEDSRSKEWTEASVSVDLGATSTSTSIADALHEGAIAQRLVSSKPDDETWTTTGGRDGEQAVGFSIRVHSYADWGLAMSLRPLVQER